jgi:hypothetical protein
MMIEQVIEGGEIVFENMTTGAVISAMVTGFGGALLGWTLGVLYSRWKQSRRK